MDENKPTKSGIPKLIDSTLYSWLGLRAAWRHEEAFRMECLLAFVLVPIGLYVGSDLTHKLLLVMTCGIVLLMELLNSAVEAVVDRIGPEQHELSGRAKDLGSAAVFTSLLLFGAIWVPSLWYFFYVW